MTPAQHFYGRVTLTAVLFRVHSVGLSFRQELLALETEAGKLIHQELDTFCHTPVGADQLDELNTHLEDLKARALSGSVVHEDTLEEYAVRVLEAHSSNRQPLELIDRLIRVLNERAITASERLSNLLNQKLDWSALTGQEKMACQDADYHFKRLQAAYEFRKRVYFLGVTAFDPEYFMALADGVDLDR